MSLRAPLSCAVIIAGIAFSQAVSAQALTSPNVGTGLSGAATVDPAAVWWNPGLLGFIDRPTALLGGSLIVGDIEYTRTRRATYQRTDALGFALPVPPENVDPSRTGTAPTVTANPIAAAPTAFLAIPITHGSSRIVASIGVYSPYAALLTFDPDGAQKWQLQAATIVTAFVTPTITWRINDVVSIGAGASYVFGFAELARVQDFATLGDVGAALSRPPISQRNDFGPSAPPGVRELDVLARPIKLRQMTASGFTFNAGIALRPTRGLLIGLSYQHSTEMTFAGRFELDLNDPFFTRDLASQGLQFPPRVEGEATLSFPLPRAVRAAVSYEVTPRLGLGLNAEFVTWSQVDRFDGRVRSPQLAQPQLGLADTTALSLPRRWKDTIAIEVTARVSVTDRLMLWGTGGFHSSATPDETIDVASPDGDRIVAALGARFRLDDRWTLYGDVEVQTIVPRTVTGSDFDLGNGEYRLTLVNLGAHVQRSF
ncbi:MAG: outer membrane protein transport protein [Polyangiales bacterium]